MLNRNNTLPYGEKERNNVLRVIEEVKNVNNNGNPNITIADILKKNAQEEDNASVTLLKSIIIRVCDKNGLKISESNLQVLNQVNVNNFTKVQINHFPVIPMILFKKMINPFFKSEKCDSNFFCFLKCLNINFSRDISEINDLFTSEFWNKVSSKTKVADYNIGIAVIYALLETDSKNSIKLDEMTNNVIFQYPENTLSLAGVLYQLKIRNILTVSNINKAVRNQSYANSLAVILENHKLNSIEDEQNFFDSILENPNLLSHIAEQIVIACNNRKRICQYNNYAFEIGDWICHTRYLGNDKINTIISGVKNDFLQPRQTFLMGLHSRIGKDSYIYKFFGAKDCKPNHPLGEKELIKNIFQFI